MLKEGKRGRGQGHVTLMFWKLNANSSKMAKGTNFKFGKHAPRQSPDMTPEKFSKRGVARVTLPLSFWALNANSSKMAKDTNFKFGMHATNQAKYFVQKNHLTEICTLMSTF